MIDIGRVCVKIAGRDAGKRCAVVEILDRNFVLVDGETRRRKCNILHLEPIDLIIEIEKGASHKAVSEALKKEGITARETKPKQAAARPVTKRASPKAAPESAPEKPAAKKAEKKAAKPSTQAKPKAEKGKKSEN